MTGWKQRWVKLGQGSLKYQADEYDTRPKGGFFMGSIDGAALVAKDRCGYEGALQVSLLPSEEKDVAENKLPIVKAGGFFSSVFGRGGRGGSSSSGAGGAAGGAGAAELPVRGRQFYLRPPDPGMNDGPEQLDGQPCAGLLFNFSGDGEEGSKGVPLSFRDWVGVFEGLANLLQLLRQQRRDADAGAAPTRDSD